MRKKALLVLITVMILSSLLILPIVEAAVPGPTQTIAKIWQEVIVPVFSFQWATNHSDETFGAFMRFIIWIIFFTLLNAIGRAIPALTAHHKHVNIITGLLSILMVIFIPIDLLLAIAEMYSTVGAVIMLAVPIVGLFYLIHLSGTWGWSPRARAVFNIAMILFLMAVLNIVTLAVEGGL